jgi:hypothetical protein
MKKIFTLCVIAFSLSSNEKAFSRCNYRAIINGSSTDSILPVEFISFKGNLNNNKVFLQWVIDKNETADRFDVERSVDGINFTMAALVFTSEKTGSESYVFYEYLNNTNKIYYRLKMYDKSKAINYSKILVFQNTSNNK